MIKGGEDRGKGYGVNVLTGGHNLNNRVFCSGRYVCHRVASAAHTSSDCWPHEVV